MRHFTDDLPEAFSSLVRTVGNFKNAGNVRSVMREVAKLFWRRVFFKSFVKRKWKFIVGRNVGERTLLLARGGGNRINGVRLKSDSK